MCHTAHSASICTLANLITSYCEQGLSKFTDEILSEAWEYEPEARITAQCIYERFMHVRDNCDINDIDDDKAKLREKTENEMNKLATEIMPSIV